MLPVFLKKSDVLPSISTILSGDGGLIDLTNATGAYFVYKPKYTGTASIGSGTLDKANSILTHTWLTGDTINIGPYYSEWRIYFSGNLQRTYPPDSYLNFEVVSGLY